MGSTLLTIRNLLEDQLNVGATTTATDPSSTVLNKYINNSIRKITRKDRPRELYSAAVTTADITESTNTVAIPSGIYIPDLVYYQTSSGTTQELRQRTLKQMIDIVGPNRFFDSTVTGDPEFYDVKGTSLIFNKYFSRTATGAISIYGMVFPTTLSDDTDITELPIDYDLMIVYESAILYYQRDDDQQNQLKFQQLLQQERGSVATSLDTNDSGVIELDPYTFVDTGTGSIKNPNIFFGSQ